MTFVEFCGQRSEHYGCNDRRIVNRRWFPTLRGFLFKSNNCVVTPFLVLEELAHPLDAVSGFESEVWLPAPACLTVGSDNVQDS